jgi:hypothetical protein
MSITTSGFCSTCIPAFQNTIQKTFQDLAAAQHDWDQCPNKATGAVQFLKPLPKWNVEKPFNLTLPLPAGQPHSNTVLERHEIVFGDVRGREARFSLDMHGFAFAKQVPSFRTHLSTLSRAGPQSDVPQRQDEGQGQQDFQGDELLRHIIEDEYVPQVKAFLQEKTGADRVVAFDYTVWLSLASCTPL